MEPISWHSVLQRYTSTRIYTALFILRHACALVRFLISITLLYQAYNRIWLCFTFGYFTLPFISTLVSWVSCAEVMLWSFQLLYRCCPINKRLLHSLKSRFLNLTTTTFSDFYNRRLLKFVWQLSINGDSFQGLLRRKSAPPPLFENVPWLSKSVFHLTRLAVPPLTFRSLLKYKFLCSKYLKSPLEA